MGNPLMSNPLNNPCKECGNPIGDHYVKSGYEGLLRVKSKGNTCRNYYLGRNLADIVRDLQ